MTYLRHFSRFALVVLGSLAGAFASASMDGIVDSVHFYGGWNEYPHTEPPPDFGRLPQPEKMPGWTHEFLRGRERIGTESDDDYDKWFRDRNEGRWSYARGRNLEVAGRYRQSLNAYSISSAEESFKRDREEVLRTVVFKNVQGLGAYLRATYLLRENDDNQKGKAVQILKALRCDPRLEPFRLYALTWTDLHSSGTSLARSYFEIYRRFPRSAKAQSTLIMAARSLLESYAHSSVPASDVPEARKYLGLLLSRFPQTRFKDDALGWLMRCDWLEGHEELAVEQYARRAKIGSTSAVRWRAYDSLEEICRVDSMWTKEIRLLLLQRLDCDTLQHQIDTSKELRTRFGRLSSAEALTVQKAIRQNPALLESYISFRIEDTQLNGAQEASLLQFAETSLIKMAKPGPGLIQRVAQIAYNNGHYGAALKLSRRALALRSSVDSRARARFVLASSLARLGRPFEAIRQYKSLARMNAPAYLVQGGQEHLALLEERYGNPLEALSLFTKIGYRYDVAYMADAELTPRQLARYISAYASPAQKPILNYTLGMKYFREGSYSRAISAFSRLSKSQRLAFGLPQKELADVVDRVTEFDKLPAQRDPVVSVRMLWNLDRKAHSVRSSAVRAQTYYAMAAYIYRQRELLFYSPGLWKGQRAYAVSYYWGGGDNTHKEDRVLDRYYHVHDTLTHVVQLCRKVEELRSSGPLAARALYTKALAEQHLSNYNPYWREHNELKTDAIASMNRLVKLYPNDPLAKPAEKYSQVFAEEDKPDYNN